MEKLAEVDCSFLYCSLVCLWNENNEKHLQKGRVGAGRAGKEWQSKKWSSFWLQLSLAVLLLAEARHGMLHSCSAWNLVPAASMGL